MDILNDMIEPRIIQYVEKKKDSSSTGKVIGFVKEPILKLSPVKNNRTLNTISYRSIK